ncbi:MAG: bifunctional 4-hydroxy-2-oxoglutarate aldolase/2-dehydro-3-deoxy-phosphogluconate aldolase [Spirochaetia bacterium]|nr:bifunctional 4-hydroxy-2-oxoglutarate aldolase/2-dehydro-3-deoxy-phosphogluconate aldolase [Spirochaetia bacterium]MCF7942596.1 bifunctional 4-hydroxy-2-oxoglutarate aldolase/2-dehydro-3-deoxy-phosphogluconate aldolase [Spirochaetia bacterium]
MEPLCSTTIETQIAKNGIVAVLVFNTLEEVRPVMDALTSGGINVIELTLRTPVALDAIRIVTQEYPQVLCGVGTILTPEQVRAAKAAGAHFGVAPGCNPRVMQAARDEGFSFAPGITTASEIESALEHGCRVLKFFPAEKIGGLAYLESMNAPYKHLGLSYIPLGGLNQDNLASYARSSIISGIGGSWLASRALIEQQQWQKITDNSLAATEVFKKEKHHV